MTVNNQNRDTAGTMVANISGNIRIDRGFGNGGQPGITSRAQLRTLRSGAVQGRAVTGANEGAISLPFDQAVGLVLNAVEGSTRATGQIVHNSQDQFIAIY